MTGGGGSVGGGDGAAMDQEELLQGHPHDHRWPKQQQPQQVVQIVQV